MATNDDDFARKLLEAFAIEAGEHVKAITAGVLELEKAPSPALQKQIIETTFREAHSLKGAARAVNRTDVEAVCQALESVFAAWKSKPPGRSAEPFDVLNRAIDCLTQLLARTAATENPALRQRIRDTTSDLRTIESPARPAARPPAAPGPPPATEPPEPEKIQVADTIRIPVAKMNSLLRKSEEMIAVKLAVRRHASGLRELDEILAAWRAAWRQMQHPRAADPAAFLEWTRRHLQTLEQKLGSFAHDVQHDERLVCGLVDDLLAEAKRLVMLPAGTLLDPFPKLVRDLSREQGKEVDLSIRGREVELDKRLLEEMKDPLMHLVRNAIDHGIEPPAARAGAGKPSRGALTLTVAPLDGNKVAIALADDGGGIDLDKVKAATVRQGLLTDGEAATMSDEAALDLIFQSGVSTSPIITEVSGRGLGMAIVREKVEKLGGQVTIHSEARTGTTFRIVLPVTLATFNGIVVTASGQTFVIPNSGIEQVARVPRDSIATVENRPTIRLGGQVLSLVSLGAVLQLPASQAAARNHHLEIVVLSGAGKRVACAVDEVLAEQEVLVKQLARPLVRVRNISSAAVLGSGSPVLILNVGDLLKSATRREATLDQSAAPATPAPVIHRVLVADDSVTSRMLLKNILETAGYEVVTSVDGADAFEALKSGDFHAVITDAEMPRLSGFELTARIRADKKFAELPVVIVTALGSREDRERGIDAGANAYIVKSTFDQTSLLEVVRKLVA